MLYLMLSILRHLCCEIRWNFNEKWNEMVARNLRNEKVGLTKTSNSGGKEIYRGRGPHGYSVPDRNVNSTFF